MADDDPIGAYREQIDTYPAQLAELAEDALHQGQNELAVWIQHWLPPPIDGQDILFDPNDSAETIPALSPLDRRFVALRLAQADALFAFARRAAEAGRPALAMQLAASAVRENPDHREARRVLGYEKVGDQWLTPYPRSKVDTGLVWHPRFGWIQAGDVPQYESGQRRWGQQWISAEEDARRHAKMEHGWTVRTEHFLVTTNAGLEAGVQLASRLETFHALWRQVFAGYYLDKKEVRELFAGNRPARAPGKPHRVRYYATRDEYNAALIHRQPKISQTLGIYFDRQRESHFFAGKEQHPATLFHETTHQIFQESRRTVSPDRALDNFWIIEGVATYMESLTEQNIRDGAIQQKISGSTRYFTLGGPNDGRLPAARERLLEDGYYIPFAEVVRLGKDALQNRPDIARLYSQLAGLTTFLVHANNGGYREPLVEYLVAVYSGRAEINTLAELTGKNLAELDREYRAWMEALR